MNSAISSISPPALQQGSISGGVNEAKLAELQGLKAQLAIAGQSSSKEVFCRAFDQAQRILGLDDNELAKTLQVSRPTVGRWASGVTAPHPIGRKPVLDYLAKRAESHLRLLRSR